MGLLVNGDCIYFYYFIDFLYNILKNNAFVCWFLRIIHTDSPLERGNLYYCMFGRTDCCMFISLSSYFRHCLVKIVDI